MRMIGMILALGAIGWVMLQAAGGPDAETAIPESYQQSMEKAQDLEKNIADMTQQKLQQNAGEE